MPTVIIKQWIKIQKRNQSKTPEIEYDTNAQTADQTSQNNCKHLELSNHQNHEVSAKTLRHQSTARQHETVGYMLFLVAMVTICQGFGFFVASCFGKAVPFLPRDQIVLIGAMYTVIGLGFLTISRFCHNSKAQRGEEGLCTCSRREPEKEVPACPFGS